MIYIFGILLFLVLIILFFSYKLSKNKKLDLAKKEEILLRLNNIIKSRNSIKEKIIDLDKLYHFILKTLWYKWSFWEILKQNPKEIFDINKIWELHKIRNKLVHDFDLIWESTLLKKQKEYEIEIKRILK